MKIGMLLDSLSERGGGVSESTRLLGHALVDQGAEIIVCALEDMNFNFAAWQQLSLNTFARTGLPGWGYSGELLPALLDANLDVLLTHGLWKYSSLASHKWHRRTNRPYVVHPHGMLESWALRNSKWKKKVAALLYEDRHLRDAACLRALCQTEAQSIRDYGLSNPICVIPNGVELPSLEQTQTAFWDKIERKTLLYLGRLHPKKNLIMLLKAWSAIQKEVSDWQLIIAGWDEGGHESELKRAAQDLGVNRSVLFSGPLFGEKKTAAYQNADAFVLPSLSEGLPMVVLEAWSYAKPVVMTPECNVPEGFEANAAVKIDKADIAQGLLELLKMSDAERSEIGRRGCDLVARRFQWPEIASEMKRVCDWLTGGGKAPNSVRFD